MYITTACYPALLVIGQMIDALNSGKYDPTRTALMITQTGGGSRASNYIHLLRKALVKAGYGYVPVISLNLSGLESCSGFRLTLPMIRKLVAGVVYGDMSDAAAQSGHTIRNQSWRDRRAGRAADRGAFTAACAEPRLSLSEFAPNLENIVRGVCENTCAVSRYNARRHCRRNLCQIFQPGQQ